jgi:FRG domain
MQHFRAPTRLLDWTEAALIALHFALQASAATATRPAVWALNPFAVNVHAGFEGALTIDRPEVRPYLPDLYTSRRELPPHPIAIDPPFVARRMLVQHSHFTVHGREATPLEGVPGLRHGRDLLKVVIDLDADDRDYLAWQLRLCGVSDTAIFPDLEGLARELGSEYGILPGPASTSAPSSTTTNATGQSAARKVTTRKP